MKSAKTRFASVTGIFLVLSALHVCYGLYADASARLITKVIPIAFLLLCACIWGRTHPRAVVALFFSLLGDIAGEMRLPGDLAFHLMILFFGIAQVHYIAEFLRYRPGCMKKNGKVCSLTPLFCAVYGVLLVGNVIASSLQRRDRKWIFILGSVLFLISDATIAVRMFTPRYAFYNPLIMVTYYLAQYLLNITVIASDGATSGRK